MDRQFVERVMTCPLRASCGSSRASRITYGPSLLAAFALCRGANRAFAKTGFRADKEDRRYPARQSPPDVSFARLLLLSIARCKYIGPRTYEETNLSDARYSAGVDANCAVVVRFRTTGARTIDARPAALAKRGAPHILAAFEQTPRILLLSPRRVNGYSLSDNERMLASNAAGRECRCLRHEINSASS
jgi:hypothetical protein